MRFKRHIADLLIKIGLNENEARFFLAAYQNPKLTIVDLRKLCHISTASAYRLFERLKDLKLLTSSKNNWRKNVETVSLHVLAEKLAQEQRRLGKIELELKKLDNLMNLSMHSSTPDPIEILCDQNQIIEKCYEIIRRPWQHMFCYGSAERLIDTIGQKPEHDYVEMRYRKRKTCDALLTELGDYTREIIPNNHRDLRNMKLRIDPRNQNYVTYIYDNEMTVWQKDDVLGNRAIVVKDRDLINIYRKNFQTIWEKC